MTMRIAVLGGGVMGETLASGFLRVVSPTPQVVVAEKRAERAAELRDALGVEIADSADAVRGAQVVVLVVKPQDIPSLLAEVGAAIEPGALVISIAAGIRTETIEAAVGGEVHVVRAMPNTPARIGLGMTGISGGSRCGAAALGLADELLSAVGDVVSLPESLQDAVTAVSGSGPAYVFLLAEAMIDAAVDLGLDAATAARMATQTILGAATLLAESGEDPEVLRRNVTSPNGTTAAAIGVMLERDLPLIVGAGMAAAHNRSRELSQS